MKTKLFKPLLLPLLAISSLSVVSCDTKASSDTESTGGDITDIGPIVPVESALVTTTSVEFLKGKTSDSEKYLPDENGKFEFEVGNTFYVKTNYKFKNNSEAIVRAKLSITLPLAIYYKDVDLQEGYVEPHVETIDYTPINSTETVDAIYLSKMIITVGPGEVKDDYYIFKVEPSLPHDNLQIEIEYGLSADKKWPDNEPLNSIFDIVNYSFVEAKNK